MLKTEKDMLEARNDVERASLAYLTSRRGAWLAREDTPSARIIMLVIDHTLVPPEDIVTLQKRQ